MRLLYLANPKDSFKVPETTIGLPVSITTIIEPSILLKDFPDEERNGTVPISGLEPMLLIDTRCVSIVIEPPDAVFCQNANKM